MTTGRSNCVKRTAYALLGSLVLFAAGCGGSTTIGGGNSGPPGEVSGVIFDSDGNVVRDADVFITNPELHTTSSSSGTYVLTDVPAVDLLVRVQTDQDGVTYIGQNLARVFNNDRAKNVNIVVVRASDVAQIHGTVRDSHGGRISGARVFAVGENNLSSSMAVTDSNGDYSIHRLAPGINYELNASTPDFRSDNTSVTLSAGDDDQEDFVLTETSGVATLSPPINLALVAWTAPDDITRSIDSSKAYEQVKRLFDPARAKRTPTTRLTPSGETIEVDATWDRVSSNFLLGYGVYRALGAAGALQSDDFLRDPLAEFYADTDDSLVENTTYSYALTSINTDQVESGFSTQVPVKTIGRMSSPTISFSPVTFHWPAATGAQNYVVFVFDTFPSVGVDSIWNNAATPVSGTSIPYGGPSLVPGNTYYVVVLGLANSNTSRTISRIVAFDA